jgi:hypothetical protein
VDSLPPGRPADATQSTCQKCAGAALCDRHEAPRKNTGGTLSDSAGVEKDLKSCLERVESVGQIASFPLGMHDVPDQLLISEKLYGRDSQIELLLTAYRQVASDGKPALVLVSGHSGIGKSKVVNQLPKHLVAHSGLFASGKFDQHKKDIPYTTVTQAFQKLVRQILSKSDQEVSQWQDRLVEALGTNGQLISNLLPELELVIGKQTPVPDLPPQDADNRFKIAFRRFLGVFGGPEHPLALFLDDLHWADVGTLQLIEHLLTEPEVRYSIRNLFSDDEYLRRRCPKSVLCMPITRQAEVVSILYLENNLTTQAFTSDRITVLKLLASQGAISLENARLYADLRQAEALLAGEKRVLEMMSRGDSLHSILEALCVVADESCDGWISAILLLDANGKRLWYGAAPRLSPDYAQAINGVTVGPDFGPCSRAARLRETIVISDISSDFRWPEYRALALENGSSFLQRVRSFVKTLLPILVCAVKCGITF